jgi:hypothetical protein
VERHRTTIFAIVGGVAGVIQAWHSRGALSPDCLNYLALARTLQANGWTPSINAFWSPLYSWLLAVPMSFHLISTRTELLWVHLINLGIFFGAMLCFHVFLSHTLRLAAIWVGPSCPAWERIETWWYLAACAIFLFVILEWLPNSLCTPDLLVAAFIFLSAGFLAAILCRDRSWPNFIVLGQTLALGYLAKAPAFPLAILFFAMLVVLSRGEKWRWAKCLASLAAFALIAGPFFYTVSKKVGRPTFGESGRVNFLIFANGVPAHWLGEEVSPAGYSRNFEKICDNPPVLAFHEVLPGVYPPVYDPTGWFAGLAPRLQLRQEARNLRAGWHTLGEMGAAESDLIVGFVLLLLISGIARGLKSVLYWWFLWLPAACGTAMFWLVHVEDRFIAPFVVLAFVGLYSGALIASCRKPRIVSKILLALLMVQGCRAAVEVLKGLGSATVSSTRDAEKTVADLSREGLPVGGKIGFIGEIGVPHWAWVGQYLIVSEVPPSGKPAFLAALPERERIYTCLKKTGARAALLHVEVPELLEPGWQKAGEGDLYMKLLGPNLRANSALENEGHPNRF